MNLPISSQTAERFVGLHIRLFVALDVNNPDRVATELLALGKLSFRFGEKKVTAVLYEYCGVPLVWPVGIPKTDDEVIRSYGRMVAKRLLRYNKRPNDFEDLLQAFWTKFTGKEVLRKCALKRSQDSSADDHECNQRYFVGYLYRSVHHFFCNWCRTQVRHVISEVTRPPNAEGVAWETTLVNDPPDVEFEDRFDLVRTLGGIPSDGATMERALTFIGNEVHRGSTLREAALQAQERQEQRQRRQERLKVRQG